MKKFIPFLCLALFVASCGSDCCKNGGGAGTSTSDGTIELLEGPKYYGEQIDEAGAMSFVDMMSKMTESDSMNLKVQGKITSVCQKKGCWMTLEGTNAEGEELFVRFKDYGFFMPMDATGKSVVVDGYAIKETVSVDELRHYAEDEGKSEDEINAITEPKDEVRFMAHGVAFVD